VQQRRLVADASHQLRNPMAALRLRMDALGATSGLAGNATYCSAVAEVERLESLLDGLLVQAAADSRTIEPGRRGRPGRDTAAVVAERLVAWQPAAEHAGVALCPLKDPPAVATTCPDADLAQILDVLLDNAIKYAGGGATVTVDLAGVDGVVRLRVTDDGPGLAGDEISLATQRFWRGRQGATKGTGLGLSIAQSLVTASAGRLAVAAARPHGLTVHIELPAVTS
jgi:signal transduction histidine kinase